VSAGNCISISPAATLLGQFAVIYPIDDSYPVTHVVPGNHRIDASARRRGRPSGPVAPMWHLCESRRLLMIPATRY
jgi:hypothetical protein